MRKLLDLGFESNVATSSGRYPIHFLIDRIMESEWLASHSDISAGWEDISLELLKNLDNSQLSIENEVFFVHSIISTGSLVLVKWILEHNGSLLIENGEGVSGFDWIVTSLNDKNASEMMDLVLSKLSIEKVEGVIHNILLLGTILFEMFFFFSPH